MPVLLVGQVDPPAHAVARALQRVAKAQLANDAHAVGRQQREQRDGGRFPEQLEACRRVAVRDRLDGLHGLGAHLLHLLPRDPAARALVVEPLLARRLLGVPAQVDELRERRRVAGERLFGHVEHIVDVRGEADQPVDVVGDAREFELLRVFEPLGVRFHEVAQVVAHQHRKVERVRYLEGPHRPRVCPVRVGGAGLGRRRRLGHVLRAVPPAQEAQQREPVLLGRGRDHGAARAARRKGRRAELDVPVQLALERGRDPSQRVRAHLALVLGNALEGRHLGQLVRKALLLQLKVQIVLQLVVEQQVHLALRRVLLLLLLELPPLRHGLVERAQEGHRLGRAAKAARHRRRRRQWQQRKRADPAEGARVEPLRGRLEDVEQRVVLLLGHLAHDHCGRVDLQRGRAQPGPIEHLPDGARRAAVGCAVVQNRLEVALEDPVHRSLPCGAAVAQLDARERKAIGAAHAKVVDRRRLPRRHRRVRLGRASALLACARRGRRRAARPTALVRRLLRGRGAQLHSGRRRVRHRV